MAKAKKSAPQTEPQEPVRSAAEIAALAAFPSPPEGVPQTSHNPETDAVRGKSHTRRHGDA